jgi:hypothetical protein
MRVLDLFFFFVDIYVNYISTIKFGGLIGINKLKERLLPLRALVSYKERLRSTFLPRLCKKAPELHAVENLNFVFFFFDWDIRGYFSGSIETF